MVSDEIYTRRMCAILIGDVSAYSALVGENDERTARLIQRMQGAVREIVSDAGGRAEARAGDAIFATFESVTAAVQAGLAIHRRVAGDEFAGDDLRVRIGVHSGDVLLREGAPLHEAVGDAINIAARLEALARPGTVCISEGVYLQVHKTINETFVDLGKQQLKHIPYPVHAYLVVPHETAGDYAPSRWRWAGAVGLLLALVLTAAVVRRYWRPAAGGAPAAVPAVATAARLPVAQVTLGVMMFKNLAGDRAGDWRGEALRDGLNGRLSQLSHVRVYSKEFLDFLVSRKGLTEIEAATQLGITKMLSGSFIVSNGMVRIETRVVDVTTGVLELSYTTTTRDADLLQMQNQLVLGVVKHLNLPVTDAEEQALLVPRSTDEEALRLLLEAEGGAAPPASPPADPTDLGPLSARSRWLAVVPRLALPARADDVTARAAILAAVERYRHAMIDRDLPALAALYTNFPPEQRAAQQRYFENVRDLKVTIDALDLAVVGDEAVVSYTRTDDFVDVRTGRPMRVAVRLTKILRLQDGTWKLAGK